MLRRGRTRPSNALEGARDGKELAQCKVHALIPIFLLASGQYHLVGTTLGICSVAFAWFSSHNFQKLTEPPSSAFHLTL